MDIEILRGEIERLFSLDELTALSRDLLGFDPHEVGGTNAKATFARALTERCVEVDAVDALVEAILGSRTNADPRLRDWNQKGFSENEVLGAGTMVGPFVIDRRLGEGSVGIVYSAEHTGNPVVLKLLRREAARDARSLHRFLTVSRLIGRVSESVATGRPDRRSPRRRRPVLRRVRKYPRRIAGGAHSSRRPDAPEGSSPDSPRRARSARCAPQSRNRPWRPQAREHHHHASPRRAGGAGRRRRHRPTAPARACTEWTFAVRACAGVAQDHRARAAAREHRAPRADVYAFGAVLFEVLTGHSVFNAPSNVDAAVAHLIEEPRPPSSVAPRRCGSPRSSTGSFSRCSAKSRPRAPRTHGRSRARSRTCREGRRRREFVAAITDEELEERIDAVLSDPADETAALLLESAAQEGAEAARIAQTFAMAAEEPSPHGTPYGQHQKNLLFRAARIYDGAGDKESAEGIYCPYSCCSTRKTTSRKARSSRCASRWGASKR